MIAKGAGITLVVNREQDLECLSENTVSIRRASFLSLQPRKVQLQQQTKACMQLSAQVVISARFLSCLKMCYCWSVCWGLTRIKYHLFPLPLPWIFTWNLHGSRPFTETQIRPVIFLLSPEYNFWLILLLGPGSSLCPMSWTAFCTRRLYRNEQVLKCVSGEHINSVPS